MLRFLREELVAFLTKPVHVKILLPAPGCLVSQSRTRPPVSACDSHTDLSSYFPSGCYRLSFHPNNGFQILKNIQVAAYRKEETAPSHKQENYDYLRKHFFGNLRTESSLVGRVPCGPPFSQHNTKYQNFIG